MKSNHLTLTLDVRTARTFAGLAKYDPATLDLVATTLLAHAEHVLISPRLAGWVVGFSTDAIRASHDGDLARPAHQGRVHRYVSLAELGRACGVAISREQLVDGLCKATEVATNYQRGADRLLTGEAEDPARDPQAVLLANIGRAFAGARVL